ncbi:MAG: hypothetical protein IPI73_25695 [Betaproteobacteria bacterium]|nr:hypothetical protein [Betaproteobacteria bacterium]
MTLRAVEVPADALLGERDGAWPAIEWVVDHALAALAAEAVGAMEGACALTLDYLKTRKQFGRAIGSFQVLQHRMVDVYVAAAESRSLALAATLHLSSAPAIRRRTAAAAKIFVGRAGRMVAEECVQMHGGIGIADEFVMGHYSSASSRSTRCSATPIITRVSFHCEHCLKLHCYISTKLLPSTCGNVIIDSTNA